MMYKIGLAPHGFLVIDFGVDMKILDLACT